MLFKYIKTNTVLALRPAVKGKWIIYILTKFKFMFIIILRLCLDIAFPELTNRSSKIAIFVFGNLSFNNPSLCLKSLTYVLTYVSWTVEMSYKLFVSIFKVNSLRVCTKKHQVKYKSSLLLIEELIKLCSKGYTVCELIFLMYLVVIVPFLSFICKLRKVKFPTFNFVRLFYY